MDTKPEIKDMSLLQDMLREAASKMGAKGGRASADALTPEQRKLRAEKAAKMRWQRRLEPISHPFPAVAELELDGKQMSEVAKATSSEV